MVLWKGPTTLGLTRARGMHTGDHLLSLHIKILQADDQASGKCP